MSQWERKWTEYVNHGVFIPLKIPITLKRKSKTTFVGTTEALHETPKLSLYVMILGEIYMVLGS